MGFRYFKHFKVKTSLWYIQVNKRLKLAVVLILLLILTTHFGEWLQSYHINTICLQADIEAEEHLAKYSNGFCGTSHYSMSLLEHI